jgi:hypothetical protein
MDVDERALGCESRSIDPGVANDWLSMERPGAQQAKSHFKIDRVTRGKRDEFRRNQGNEGFIGPTKQQTSAHGSNATSSGPHGY